MIRRTAQLDDLIFGFAANSLDADNRLIYVARITEESPNGEYYSRKPYSGRNDRVYERRGDRLEWRTGALFHGPANQHHDVGEHPAYERARVLLSDDFRYFGSAGTAEYKASFSVLRVTGEGMKQGHRVITGGPLWDELLRLKTRLWQETTQKTLGEPSVAVVGNRRSNRECIASTTRLKPIRPGRASPRC